MKRYETKPYFGKMKVEDMMVARPVDVNIQRLQQGGMVAEQQASQAQASLSSQQPINIFRPSGFVQMSQNLPHLNAVASQQARLQQLSQQQVLKEQIISPMRQSV